MTDPALEGLLAAAEPTEPAPLGGLIDRLATGGRALGARTDGQAIGPTGLSKVSKKCRDILMLWFSIDHTYYFPLKR